MSFGNTDVHCMRAHKARFMTGVAPLLWNWHPVMHALRRSCSSLEESSLLQKKKQERLSASEGVQPFMPKPVYQGSIQNDHDNTDSFTATRPKIVYFGSNQVIPQNTLSLLLVKLSHSRCLAQLHCVLWMSVTPKMSHLCV